MNRYVCLPFLLLSVTALAQTASRPPLTVETIMQDPKRWVGTSPSNPFWSDDSQTLYFSWNPANAPGGPAKGDSLYKVTFARTGSGRRSVLTPSVPTKVGPAERRALPVASIVYNRTRTQRLFERQGDLFVIDVRSGQVRQLTNTVETESEPGFWENDRSVAFRRGANLFSINLQTGELAQLTDFRSGSKREAPKLSDQEKALKADQLRLSDVLRERKEKRDEAERITKADRPRRPKEIHTDDRTLVSPQISPDGRFVTYRLTKTPPSSKSTVVPNYVTESGYTENIPSRTKVGSPLAEQPFFVYDRQRDTVRQLIVADKYFFAAKDSTGKARTQTIKTDATKLLVNGPLWSEDGNIAVVVVRSFDNKDRWICRLHPDSLTLTLLDHQHDDAWIGGPGIGPTVSMGSMGFLADNQTLWFQSEADGYSHLYTVNAVTGERKQLTSGKFEVQQVTLSKDKTHFYLQTNEVHPGEQHAYRMAVTGGPRTQLTTMAGANDVTLSPDETRLAIRYSSSTQPWELYVVNNEKLKMKSGPSSGENAPVRLTQSQTDAFRAYPWRDPTLVTIPARDGQSIYARLYKPEKPNGKSVVFVHGAGYLQNAHKWWSQYFREYMFHNLLADKGFTVLDIDYRASAGYGRDWRTGIYRHMGGKDLDDHVDAARWLVKTQGVDAGRIGIYGGSYGGFMTLMAMFTQSDVFKAGAALRPVTDWAAYNHPYTANILNEPQTDTLAYRRSSPIFFADGLRGHLLICHGLVDVNVHAQDAIRLAQRLIELKKENWELALYPMEDHAFVEPTSWMDEYKRILKLFEERL
ncbi:S9 family peptidase [Spirosoma montaniterrae]|uniref:Peptidase S9 n=1 Tax=Spirosoma montaniterrae TaxID=1178516 RepID=A0A1P9X3Y6_9BACT|nr:prolyl oligopeptidase family serine peptidase [Spirosoma montaniterrae]AQG82331.1 peptidase S9 [Spirosoma montaniterrae]